MKNVQGTLYFAYNHLCGRRQKKLGMKHVHRHVETNFFIITVTDTTKFCFINNDLFISFYTLQYKNKIHYK